MRAFGRKFQVMGSETGHEQSVRAMSFSPNGAKLCTGSEDQMVKIWDFATVFRSRKCEPEQAFGHGSQVWCAQWHPHKNLIVSGTRDNKVKLWAPQSGSNG